MSFDDEIDGLATRMREGRIDRREFVRRLAVLGLAPSGIAAFVAACGVGGGESAAPAPAETTGSTAAAATTTATAPAAGTVPGPPYEGGTQGGIGRVAFQDERPTFDPPTAYGFANYNGIQNYYRGLFFYGLNTEAQPDLAESMDVNDDATSYVFKIKKGVTFHNGRELTADDFKFTWERATSKDTASWVQGFFNAVVGYDDFIGGSAKELTGIKVVDPYTIQIDLSRPDVTIPGILGVPVYYALPAKEVQEQGKSFQFFMGTGPFKLENADIPGRRITASRFDDYVYADQKLPYLDSLDWSWGVNQQLQYLRVLRGDLDSTGDTLAAAITLKLQKSAPEGQFNQYDSLQVSWVEFDWMKKPFDDLKVRQAFNYAIDRDRLKTALVNPTAHFWPPSLLGYDDSLQTFTYDPEKAKSLLAEAGYSGGLDVPFPILGVSQGIVEQLLQQDLKAVGLNLTLDRNPATIFELGTKVRDKYPAWLRGWAMGLPDPTELVNSLIATGAPNNYGGYGNADVDALGKQAQSETDRTKRGDDYAQIEQMLFDDAAFGFLGVGIWSFFHSDKLQNFIWEPANLEHWDIYWLSS